ncbi:MAG: hypothetical protein CPSOU_3637 [uncultured Paraburkholderia sp.]|nr:MAG: hypothetical protein CPSOU_3637 [uncultured Paraburkholderia sp.]
MLRYHSKRREGSGSTADGHSLSGAFDPEGLRSPSCSTARRARIIGAFALFVST